MREMTGLPVFGIQIPSSSDLVSSNAAPVAAWAGSFNYDALKARSNLTPAEALDV
jgi:hypothetical protein